MVVLKPEAKAESQNPEQIKSANWRFLFVGIFLSRVRRFLQR